MFDRFSNGEFAEVVGALEHYAQLLAPGLGGVGRVETKNAHLATVAMTVALEDLDHGCLAGTVGTQDRDTFARGDAQVEVRNRDEVAVSSGQARDFDCVHARNTRFFRRALR